MKVDEKTGEVLGDEQNPEVEIVSGAGGRLSWEQRTFAARLAIAAQDSTLPTLEHCEHDTLHLTGLAIFPAKSAEYPNITEVAVIQATEGTYRSFAAAGISSTRTLLSALGSPPWPEPFPAKVTIKDTKHGGKASLG